MKNPHPPTNPRVPRTRIPSNQGLKVDISENIVGPQRENCFVQAQVNVAPSRALDSVSIEDHAAKNIIEHNNEGLSSEIVDWFAQQHKVDRESLKIEKLKSGKGINANYHYIITNDKKEYHIKPALHGVGLSLGSKFNEIAFYKLNENLKIGPKCDAFVSRIGILMICTEDLKFRSFGNAQGKTISFKDNEFDKAIVAKIPDRDKDNVHRCVSEIAINLLSYADVQRNYSNTGLKLLAKLLMMA